MKKTLYFIVVFSLFIGFSGIGQSSPETKENVVDDVNFSLTSARALPIVGQLNGSSASFLRPSNIPLSTVAYDPTCSGSFATAPASTCYFAVYTFTATQTEELVLTLETPNSGSCCTEFDPLVLLYCAPFNPNNPLLNLRAGNDDAGVGFWSAFPAGSGVMIEAGNTYDIVVTHFTDIQNLNGPVDYTLTVANDVDIQGHEVPLSNWALGIGIFLIIAATVFRMRRMS